MEDVLQTALGTFIGVGALLLILLIQHEAEKRKKREAAKPPEALDNFLDEMTRDMREERQAVDMLEAVSRDIIGNRKAKASDAPKIEKAFHENMEDHWVKLEFDKKTGKFGAKIQKHPFEVVKPKRVRKPSANVAQPRKPIAKKPVTNKKGSK